MDTDLKQFDTHIGGYFHAMVSPCEVLVDTGDRDLAQLKTDTVTGKDCKWRLKNVKKNRTQAFNAYSIEKLEYCGYDTSNLKREEG